MKYEVNESQLTHSSDYITVYMLCNIANELNRIADALEFSNELKKLNDALN